MSASAFTTPRRAGSLGGGAFPLLLLVGALLAVAVLLSKVAASHGAPMLAYLSLAMGGSGLVLALRTGRRREPGVQPEAGRAGPGRRLAYSLVAGALMALGSALGYLTVHRVGAAFIALALAFPPMLTWLLSIVLRLEAFDRLRLAGLLTGLAGGVLLAVGKGVGATPADIGAIALACAMPAVLAVGNVFRSRYWPKGAAPSELAGGMLLCGALLTLPFALAYEGGAALVALFRPPLLWILLCAVATFTAQYVAFFRLQQIAGPVYMSQIGSVAAVVGSPVAVLLLGEQLPAGFALAVLLVVVGLGLFQHAQHVARRRPAPGRG